MSDEPKIRNGQFLGLPMADLIGGPLLAATEAQMALAKSTAAFIEEVGAMPPAQFNFDRPKAGGGQEGETERVRLDVPLLSIVPIPSLGIDEINFKFDMQVTSATVDPADGEAPGKLRLEGVVAGSGPRDPSADQAGNYNIDIRASTKGVPEGLARVLDMLNSAIAPSVKPGA